MQQLISSRLPLLVITFPLLVITELILLQQSAFAQAEAAAQNSTQSLSQSVLQVLKEEDGPAKAFAKFDSPDLQALQVIDPFGVQISPAVAGLHRSLLQLASEERFEVLSQWSFPDGPSKRIRILSGLVPETSPPDGFARALGERPGRNSFPVAKINDVSGLFCSAWLLIQAADESGNLPGLIVQLEELAGNDIPNAGFMLTLARIQDQRIPAEQIRSDIAARIAENVKVPGSPNIHDAVLVAAALSREELREDTEQLAGSLIHFDPAKPLSAGDSFLRKLNAVAILRSRAPESNAEDLLKTPPHLWIAAGDHRSAGFATGTDRSIWLMHEDHIQRLTGSGDDLLLFQYPLSGQFELKAEMTSPEAAPAGLTFGGISFAADPQWFTVTDVMRDHSHRRQWPFVAPKELRLFNRVNIRSDGQNTLLLSNLHPGWKITAAQSDSCPWLGLRTSGFGKVYFRNLQLIGEPVIPREVLLTNHPGLPGWVALSNESLPHVVQPLPSAANVDEPSLATDWFLSEGELHGRRSIFPLAGPGVAGPGGTGLSEGFGESSTMQSHLAYVRPLLDGETLKYEFVYDPDPKKTTAVHPVLGRIAFLIEPSGVRLHWITHNENEWTGLEPDNAIVEAVNRRGPSILPLIASDWNHVLVTRDQQKLKLTLNGTLIYEKPVEELSDFHPGFYHDRSQTDVRIRNVVLTGNWPEKLTPEQMQNPVAMGAQ